MIDRYVTLSYGTKVADEKLRILGSNMKVAEDFYAIHWLRVQSLGCCQWKGKESWKFHDGGRRVPSHSWNTFTWRVNKTNFAQWSMYGIESKCCLQAMWCSCTCSFYCESCLCMNIHIYADSADCFVNITRVLLRPWVQIQIRKALTWRVRFEQRQCSRANSCGAGQAQCLLKRWTQGSLIREAPIELKLEFCRKFRSAHKKSSYSDEKLADKANVQ